MTLVGTLWKNKSKIPSLFLSGKQREVLFSFFFTNDITLVSYVPARKKAVILLSSQHDYNTCMGEEKDHKPEFIMHSKATKSGSEVLDKLVRKI
jgi:hypothetical protein